MLKGVLKNGHFGANPEMKPSICTSIPSVKPSFKQTKYNENEIIKRYVYSNDKLAKTIYY
ncbi:MAG: hypothetical protein COA79_21565 [Planctomycetota bacterium]|nr:MAG: hypothetical protein COA79_21565 [Planctomycetota bacterium]